MFSLKPEIAIGLVRKMSTLRLVHLELDILTSSGVIASQKYTEDINEMMRKYLEQFSHTLYN